MLYKCRGTDDGTFSRDGPSSGNDRPRFTKIIFFDFQRVTSISGNEGVASVVRVSMRTKADSTMRPHTRTQCTDGKDCSACNPGLAAAGPPFDGEAAAGTAKSAPPHPGSSASHYPSAPPAAAGCSGGSPFVAPTSGPLRRSLTHAAKSQGHVKSGGDRSIPVVELPAEILVKILTYLSFKEISQVRLVSSTCSPLSGRPQDHVNSFFPPFQVSRRFNEICASMLNSTFQRLQSHMLSRFQSIKGQMPRRESARR